MATRAKSIFVLFIFLKTRAVYSGGVNCSAFVDCSNHCQDFPFSEVIVVDPQFCVSKL